MNRNTFAIILSFVIPMVGMSQETSIDDIYFKPSDAKVIDKESRNSNRQVANYKNGAKEIVFIERGHEKQNSVQNSEQITGTVLAHANDSLQNLNQSGNESDTEYAARIHRFHSPNGSNVTNNYYYDQSYDNGYNNAYYNWNYSPYAYSDWGWGSNWYHPYGSFYSPWGYSGYNNWYGYGMGGFYGGFSSGFYGCGYYGAYNYPYYGGYYGYSPYCGNYWGSSSYIYRNSNRSEADRRAYNNTGGTSRRVGESLPTSQIVNSRESSVNSSRAFTQISGSRTGSPYESVGRSGSRSASLLVNSGSRNSADGTPMVQDRSANRSSIGGFESRVSDPSSRVSTINTRPRTTNYSSSYPSEGVAGARTSNSIGYESRGNYSSSSRTNEGSYSSNTNTRTYYNTSSPTRNNTSNYVIRNSSPSYSRGSSGGNYSAPASSGSSSSSRSSGSSSGNGRR